MIQTWPFEQPLEVVWGTLGGLSPLLAISGGHERALVLLLVLLLVGTVGGAFISVPILLFLAFQAVKNHPNHLLARGMAGGDVEELLGGLWALIS